jgi:hypothetical protein
VTKVSANESSNRVGIRSAATCVLALGLGLAVFGIFRVLDGDNSVEKLDGNLGAANSTVFARQQAAGSPRPTTVVRPRADRPGAPPRPTGGTHAPVVGSGAPDALPGLAPVEPRTPVEAPSQGETGADDRPAAEAATAPNTAGPETPTASPEPLVDLPDPLPDPQLPLPPPSVPPVPPLPPLPSLDEPPLPSGADLPLPTGPILP